MIRPMEASDIARVAEIDVFGRRCAYRGIVSDDDLFNKIIVPKRIERLTNNLDDIVNESYVYDDGIIKGFLKIGPCEDEDETGSFEIWSLYIDPFMQRQGIGSTMLDFSEITAKQRGYNKICLWTLEKNAAARAFYEKLGYAPDGAKKFLEDIEAYQVRYFKELRM